MNTTINTALGPVVGKVENDLLIVRGIPFASAERFERPERRKPWTEPLDCTERGPVCPQLPFAFEFVIGPVPLREMSEDCLRASIVAPANCQDLPVLVWYHGGANISGSADTAVMDTSALASLGMVVIAVQYRLGIFGCLNFDNVENLHVYDQLEALKWSHENARAFGGDPDKITIMGQSAGGIAVYNMLRTSNLFKKAIMISAPINIMTGQSNARESVAKAAGKMEGSMEDLLKIQERVSLEASKKGNMVEAFSADHSKAPFTDFHEAELLVGWAADDILPFLRLHPAGQLVANIPYVNTFASRVATGAVFKNPAKALAAKYEAKGWRATTYQWDWFPPANPFRACHCIEMPFMFDGWAHWSAAPLMAGAKQEQIEKLGHEFKKMIYNFVTRGLSTKHFSIDAKFTADAVS